MAVRGSTENKRLIVSRLIRFDHTDALVSDQRENQSVLMANGSPWRIVGKAPRWTAKANESGREALTSRVKSSRLTGAEFTLLFP